MDPAAPEKAGETGQEAVSGNELPPENSRAEEQPPSLGSETEPGLSALSPAEDWISGTDYGKERDERLLVLLETRSSYVKDRYLGS